MRSRREEWTDRVRRWRRSGLTAEEFANSIGVRVGTLTHWAWQLGHELRTRQAKVTPPPLRMASVMEWVGGGAGSERFELVLGNGRRLHIPARFEADALKRLLAVVEDAQ